MDNDEGKNEKQNVNLARTPIFGKTYATNVLTSLTDSDFRIELLNEKFKKDDDSWVYHSDHLAILTMEAAKKLYLDLEKKINDYEEENGEIDINNERMNL